MNNLIDFINKVNALIINPLVTLFFVVSIAIFFYGFVEFLFNRTGRESDDALEKGKRHMLFGVLGMFIMMATFGIIRVIVHTIEADKYLETGLNTGQVKPSGLVFPKSRGITLPTGES